MSSGPKYGMIHMAVIFCFSLWILCKKDSKENTCFKHMYTYIASNLVPKRLKLYFSHINRYCNRKIGFLFSFFNIASTQYEKRNLA